MAGIKRVPEDHVAVNLNSPAARPLPPGTHFVRPFGGAWLTVPTGVFERRFPAEGELVAAAQDGTEVRLVLGMRLRVQDPVKLHTELGSDYETAIERLVRDAVEIELAQRELYAGAELPPDLPQKFGRDVLASLQEAGLTVAAVRVDEWRVGRPGAPIVANVTPEPIRRIIFVGADGADWMVIDRLMAEGRLPNFKRIVEGGATGVLESMEPMLSPLLWTTMATGKMPEDHGILNFTVFDKETGKRVPITRMSRKVDAFWNMLSDYNRRTSIIGWLATYPAEEIQGVMVTDRVGYLAFAEVGDEGVPDNAITPEGRVDEMAALVVNGSQVEYDAFKRFVNLNAQEFAKARSVAFDPKDPVNNMIMLYATAESFRAISNHVVDRDNPDFLAVYYELIDATGHLFMHYAQPRRDDVTDEQFRRFSNAVDEAYVLQDEILGEMLARLDDNTVLMVVSDHGWKSGDLRPNVSPEIWGADAVRWHRKDGIVMFYGNGVRAGHRMERYSLPDVAPTVLALQGFPRVADMPGRVMASAFDETVTSQFSSERVATLEREREEDKMIAAAEAGDAEALKKLEALGYITPENPFSHNNLGQRYMDEGRIEEAIEEFKKALELQPEYTSALNNLGAAYGRLKQYDKAEAALRKTLELNPEDLYAINNLAVMNTELRRFDEALRWAQRAVEVEPQYANGHITLGSILAQTGQFDKAQAAFERALELEPDNDRAARNLERVKADRARAGG